MSGSEKEAQTIDKMFKKQDIKKVCRIQMQITECPACGIHLPENMLNLHLDKICPSKTEMKLKASNIPNYEKGNSTKQERVFASKNIKKPPDAFKIKKQSHSKLSLKRSLVKNDEIVCKKTKNNALDDSFCFSKNNVICSLVKASNDEIYTNHASMHDDTYSFKCKEPLFPQLKDENIKDCSYSDAEKIIEKIDVDIQSEAIDDETSPYYLVNFKHIIDTVLQDKNDSKLFSEEDNFYINKFQIISEPAQKLYARLFQRKYYWIRLHKICYQEIGPDLIPVLEELVQSKLLLSGEHIEDLKTALDLLSVSEIKKIGKTFNINITGKSKNEILNLLLKYSCQQKSVFGCGISGDMVKIIMKRVIHAVGPCFKLSPEPRSVFVRIMILFFLPFSHDDESDSSGGFQQHFFTLLMIRMGKLVFPEFKVMKQAVLFRARDDLIKYEAARQLENDINRASELKDFELALKLFHTAKEQYHLYFKSNATRDSFLPHFLRRLTTGHIYIRCLSHGVDVFQKLKKYDEAVILLEELLKQMIYCQDYRGHWWDRLALNLDQHLKQPEKSLNAIYQGIADQQVRTGHRFALISRAHRLHKSFLKRRTKYILPNFEIPTIREAPKVVIKGCLLPCSLQGQKHVFISKTKMPDDNITTLLGVEELALNHYKVNNFTEGIHGEGATFVSLFGLMFWEIIYGGQMPDVFISPYQSYPLDLTTDNFYAARQTEITSRLNFIRNSTVKELEECVQKIWESENGKLSLVSWEKFTGYLQIQGLIKCLKQHILVGICERLAKDFRHCRSGVPDLVVWNPLAGTVKIVEVKGPGDHLSPKQIMWLDYLLNIGANVEVCHVEVVNSKRL